MNKSTSYTQWCSNPHCPKWRNAYRRIETVFYASRQPLALLTPEMFDLIHCVIWAYYLCGNTLTFFNLKINRHGLILSSSEPRSCRPALFRPHFKSCLLNKRLESYEGQINRLYSLVHCPISWSLIPGLATTRWGNDSKIEPRATHEHWHTQ